MKILYLYAELMGYQIPIFKEYINKYNANVHIVHWDQKKLTPYTPPELKNVFYYNRSEFSIKQLKELAAKINPDIVYISGWQDLGYLKIARILKSKNIPVVCGFDDQWIGSLRQKFASLFTPYILQLFFSHAWVAGPYQYEYAKKLGFKKNKIIYNLLSGDTLMFAEGYNYLINKTENYPKTFLYVGRFNIVKGIDILIEAYNIYIKKYKGKWDLICIGNGNLKYLLQNKPGIKVLDFLNQEELVKTSKIAGALILPSKFEPWGVVVHEFAAAGLPLLLSENVGANPTFLIKNFNGLIFKNNSALNLAEAMYIMSNKNNDELIKMSKNSYLLSQKISPEISAASFMSILNKL